MRCPTFKPKCPTCGATLEVPFPLPEKGVGRCPVGYIDFTFYAEVDKTKVVKDKNGKLEKEVRWNVKGPKHD